MRISTFLPHVEVFGGVRRLVELGNAWVRMGHHVTLYHPTGQPPTWLPYAGRVAPLAGAARDEADLAVCADPHTYAAFRAHPAGTHLYYCVIQRDAGLTPAIGDRAVRLAANSSALRAALARRAGRPVLDGAGGIDAAHFYPDPSRRASSPLRVLLNGRRSRSKKGTDLILSALRGLAARTPPLEVVLFDSLGPANALDPRAGAPLPPGARFVLGPSQRELAELYQSAHVFVAAERKAGWCNTALEAMACGCAVVCTPSGTGDFARHGETAWVVRWRNRWALSQGIRRVLHDEGLRRKLEAAGPAEARRWEWSGLARKLLEQLEGS